MYALSVSESNLGRGEDAFERGVVGERMPDKASVAMMGEA